MRKLWLTLFATVLLLVGSVGDGKIFITDIGRVIRIRTGETDDAAL